MLMSLSSALSQEENQPVRLMGLVVGLTFLGAVFLLTEPQVRAVSGMLVGWGLGTVWASFLGDAVWFGLLAWAFTVADSFICAKLSGRGPLTRNRKL